MRNLPTNPKVCVVGLGYIGLPVASLLATKGYDVIGVDVKPSVVSTINRGEIHIVEPSLDVVVKSAVQSGKLYARETPEPADVFIIAVPTPLSDNCAPDISYVIEATESIAPRLSPGNLVVLESTSPVGTTERVVDVIEKIRPDLTVKGEDVARKIFVAHCPERVLPGKVLSELVECDRVIGGLDAESGERAAAFYQGFVGGKIFLTDARTAELCKLAENTFRDVNIAFANELATICETLGVDVWHLIELANRHPRVNILRPGPGVGGHCISVDPWFIIDSAPHQSTLMRAARTINDGRPAAVIEQVVEMAKPFENPTVACLGLSFKANVDDLRESPAVDIALGLARSKLISRVIAVEPYIESLPVKLQDANIELLSLDDAVAHADVCVLLVDHGEFVGMDVSRLAGKLVLDTRGIWRHFAKLFAPQPDTSAGFSTRSELTENVQPMRVWRDAIVR